MATYQAETETLELKFFRTIATERDAILNLTLLLFGMNAKDVLPRLEGLFSQKITEIFANQGVKDPRVPLEYDELDVAASLDSMTNPGEKIIDALYEHLKPLYDAFLDDKLKQKQQLDLAKKAIFKAHECLLFYKRDNNGQLPIAVFKNLLPGDPNTSSRHVTIAISGWLS